MMLIVPMEFAYIIDIPKLYSICNKYVAIYVDDEFDSLLVSYVIRFFLFVYGGGKFLTSLDGYRILGIIRMNLGFSYCENAFVSFSK